MFRTLTEKYFREIPGWVGNCPDNRPFDFEKEEKRLIESGQLWTLEKFARYWFDVIVPGYNNFIPEDEKESPLQKYMRMEKADTIVPDWDTLTVFMKQKTRHKVHTQGIKYNNDLFWHPSLAEEGVMGNYVYIYDFDQSFCHSISVIHNRKYLFSFRIILPANEFHQTADTPMFAAVLIFPYILRLFVTQTFRSMMKAGHTDTLPCLFCHSA